MCIRDSTPLPASVAPWSIVAGVALGAGVGIISGVYPASRCLLYTSDAADERSSVDLGGRRIIKKKTRVVPRGDRLKQQTM